VTVPLSPGRKETKAIRGRAGKEAKGERREIAGILDPTARREKRGTVGIKERKEKGGETVRAARKDRQGTAEKEERRETEGIRVSLVLKEKRERLDHQEHRVQRENKGKPHHLPRITIAMGNMESTAIDTDTNNN
jgi:hypothetical protein